MALIKLAQLLLMLLPLSQPEGITRTWTFTGDAHGVKACGFLHMEKGGTPFGGMWFTGAENGRTRLAGLNQGPRFGRKMEHDDHTLMFDPIMPWMVGTISWSGDAGVVDILSTDYEFGEIPVTVEVQ